MGGADMTGVIGALYRFFSSFDIDCYAEDTINKTGATPPYISVQLVVPDWTETVGFYARLWYRADDMEGINAKADEIGAAIGAGASVPIEGGGTVWIYKDGTFAQHMTAADPTMKCIYLRMKIQAICE